MTKTHRCRVSPGNIGMKWPGQLWVTLTHLLQGCAGLPAGSFCLPVHLAKPALSTTAIEPSTPVQGQQSLNGLSFPPWFFGFSSILLPMQKKKKKKTSCASPSECVILGHTAVTRTILCSRSCSGMLFDCQETLRLTWRRSS